jgi:hypothetical protein
MAKQKMLYRTMDELVHAWLAGKNYGSLKYKRMKECTFVKDMMFIGNKVIAYRHKPSNTYFMYGKDIWNIRGRNFGIHKSNKCLRDRISIVKGAIKNSGANYHYMNYPIAVLGLEESYYVKAVELEIMRDCADKHSSAVGAFGPEEESTRYRHYYWKERAVGDMSSLLAQVDALNKVCGFSVSTGLSPEERATFELNKMMYILNGVGMGKNVY